MEPLSFDDEKLQINDVCSSGGFGVVYDGEYDNKPVKVKFIKKYVPNKSGTSHYQSLLQILPEILFPAFTAHPAINKVLGYSIDLTKFKDIPSKDYYAYIVLEKNGDQNLENYVESAKDKSDKDFCLNLTCQLFCVCRGLLALNSFNDNHYDIKPTNLVVKDKFAWIIDYGISEHGEKSGSASTQGYQNLDNPSDTYSFIKTLENLTSLDCQICNLEFLSGHANSIGMDYISLMFLNDKLYCYGYDNDIDYIKQEFKKFRENYLKLEIETKSQIEISSVLDFSTLLVAPARIDIIQNIVFEAENGKIQSILLLAMMWGSNVFGRVDNYCALFYCLEAQKRGYKNNDLLDIFMKRLNINITNKEKTTANIEKLLKEKLINDAKNGNWIAQTRLGIMMKQAGINNDLADQLIKIGKDRNCFDIDCTFNIDVPDDNTQSNESDSAQGNESDDTEFKTYTTSFSA